MMKIIVVLRVQTWSNQLCHKARNNVDKSNLLGDSPVTQCCMKSNKSRRSSNNFVITFLNRVSSRMRREAHSG